MRALRLLLGVTSLSVALAACDGSSPSGADAGADAGSGTTDAGDVAIDAGGDTWGSFAEGFFATYCVSCHDTSPKDFRQIEDVRAWADTIRCGVSDVALEGCGSTPPPRQFPVGTGPHPSDAERERLVAWIDAGMPE